MTLVAGALGGTLMGLIFVTHASLVLTFRPPGAVTRRVQESSITGLIMMGSLFALTGWLVLGVLAALLFAVADDGSGGFDAVPNAPYLFAVIFLALVTAIPAAVFLRDRLRHLAVEYLLFIGIFGWLIPFMVTAASDG